MTALTISVEDAELRAALAALQARAVAPGPVLQDIGAALESRIQQRFDFKRDPNGTAWAPWAGSTAAQRAKEGRGELLIHGGPRSQHLRDSLNYQIDGASVAVGFAADYALFHEFGTTRMPRRGLLMADPEAGLLAADDARLIVELLAGYLD